MIFNRFFGVSGVWMSELYFFFLFDIVSGVCELRSECGVSITLHESIVLFGHDVNFRSNDTFDLIILVAKFFIYKCKVKKIIPQFHFLKQYLRNTFEVYKHNSKVNMSYNKFMTSWHLYKTLVQP